MQQEASNLCFSSFLLLSLLANLAVSDLVSYASESPLPVRSQTLSPSSVSFSPSSYIPNPSTGSDETLQSNADGSISAPPLSSIPPSSELAVAPSFKTNGENLPLAPAPGNVAGMPESNISLPPNADSQAAAGPSPKLEAPAPEVVITNGGEDMSSHEPSYFAPPPYVEVGSFPPTLAPSLNGGGEGGFDIAPSNRNPKVLPFDYRAEDEPVDPYPGEETHGGVNSTAAGVVVSVGVVGLACFIYHKKRNKHVRAQYQLLGRNNAKKSFSL